MRYVGKPIPRFEDLHILYGGARYVDDIEIPGVLYAGFVRSPYAHARVKRVDASEALATPGVVAVFTPESGRPFDFAPGGKVRYQGEAVAMVVAADRYKLYDALEKVYVDYEPLPAVVDPIRAMEPGAPLVEESLGTNISHVEEMRAGDAETALRASDRTVEEVLTIQRIIPSAMEPRGVLAIYDGKSLTVYDSTQKPHIAKREIAASLDLPLSAVRVIQPYVGGAFGSKIQIYPEEIRVAAAAYALRRPVRWTATRSEDFKSATHGRAIILRYKAGFTRDGVLRAIKGEVIADAGAYDWGGRYLAETAAEMLPGPYRVKDLDLRAISVLTNKAPLGPYRGAGRPEATFFIERIMDLIADETGLDPVEVRRRNLVERAPYENPFGLRYDSGEYLEGLAKGIEALGYYELIRQAEAEKSRGKILGVGLSYYIEITTYGHEVAVIRAEPDGSFLVALGIAPHGQGDATAIAQLVADELGVPMEKIRVVWGDTDLVPDGLGTDGSRSVTAGGSAAILAARRLKEELAKAAEALLGTPVEYKDGVFYGGGKSISIGEVVEAVYRGKAKANLEVTEVYRARSTFPYGVYVAVVELDPETGVVKPVLVRSYDDVGQVVNPLLAAGQVHGGVLQAIGQALYEEAIYDQDGNLLTPNFAFYNVPTAAEAPRYEVHFAENPHKSEHPTGTKGIGEAPTVATTPAVVRAVEDAIRRAGGRARFRGTPIRPEDVLRALGRL
ncbi:MAG: glyceraldehyde dehydrogenase subunit alpha [Thermoproteus sp. AZ2]|uniref:Glyceraldehyde dehydrogenase subunit alpha n=1 Tax=Thermoproteus sp. AZ2 TaxID=1609232 RepID=A0ACC6V0X6_9CREN